MESIFFVHGGDCKFLKLFQLWNCFSTNRTRVDDGT